ncbi:MAG TPA: ABC-F family ATP-binding cassette domain-containing protein [Jiangellales bacterium]|nr:ABC-F family ATP-binding cassette domain-containing protein [Jiangellales bacterium]
MAVNLVNLESVGLALGTRQVLRDVSLGIAQGDRIGVVGRNGSGKTTLVSVLAREQPVDSGRVTHTGGLRVGRLAQVDDLPAERTVRELVLGSRAEHEWAGQARVREVLANLLPGVQRDAAVGPLSGGERRRVSLARLLVGDDDLILLDEPTNHLDVEAIDWLARHLRSSGRTIVLVSHDRWLLDSVCDTLWEVVDGDIRSYDGGYSEFVLARAERERIAAATEARRANLLRKELAWLRRGPPARTSKPKFRIEAANALIADEPPPRDRYELARFAAARLGKSGYDLEDVTIGFGGPPLLDRVTWRLGPGDRVGVVGANGSGKTTLLRLLAGELRPQAGKVRVGPTVVPAYLSQEVTELDRDMRVLDAAEEVRRVTSVGRRELTARQLLEQFGFTGPTLWTPVSELSGGERRRLQLLRLLMAEPNVLLLDEPTNDLDIETLTVLEDLLDRWAGTVVVVSHDRWFLERTTDAIWALPGDGSLVHLPGGVEEYLQRRRAAAADAAGSRGPFGEPAGSARPRVGDTRAARKELARIERELDKLSRREERLHLELAEHATDPQRVLELDGALRQLQGERESLEANWLELAEQVE